MQMQKRLSNAKNASARAAGESWRQTCAGERAKASAKRSMPRAMLEERCATQEKLLHKARQHADDALAAARVAEKFEDITQVVTVVDRLASLIKALEQAGIRED